MEHCVQDRRYSGSIPSVDGIDSLLISIAENFRSYENNTWLKRSHVVTFQKVTSMFDFIVSRILLAHKLFTK